MYTEEFVAHSDDIKKIRFRRQSTFSPENKDLLELDLINHAMPKERTKIISNQHIFKQL